MSETRPPSAFRRRLAIAVAALASLALVVAAATPLVRDELPRWLRFSGRLHPLLLHVPIGCLVALLALELVGAARRSLPLGVACRALLWLTALTAVPTALAGLLLSTEGGYDEDLLAPHRSLGVLGAALVPWLLVLRPTAARPSLGRGVAYGALLLATVAVVGATGHLGAGLTHGATFLSRYWGPEAEPAAVTASEGASEGAPHAELPATPDPASGGSDFDRRIRPVLDRWCARCHGPEKQKGDIRLDVLDADVAGGADAETWDLVLEMLSEGDMPPEDEDQPSAAERELLVAWLRESLATAAVAHTAERGPTLRRLTKAQYTNTLQHLLGVGVDFGRMLPDEAKSQHGFTNAGSALQVSPLHVEYWQSLARQALAAAIAPAEKPAVARYRVTFGKGRGKGHLAAETGGYQAVPLSTDDFRLEILDDAGNPRAGSDDAERAQLDAIRRRISVGLRGSAQDRFRIVDEGMLLFSALPHKEVVPQAWQGPSPNLKLEMQRCFPEQGDFVMRVRASRGYVPATHEQLLVAPDEPVARTSLDDGNQPVTEPGAIVLAASVFDELRNVALDGDALAAVDVPTPASARAFVELPADGFWQFDLVHPAANVDAMASVRLGVDKFKLDLRPQVDDGARARGRAVTPIGVAALRGGRHKVTVGGPFFIGFSHVVVTRMPDDHPQAVRLSAIASARSAALGDEVPAIRAFVGTRTDDGMDYRTFDEPQEVRAELGAAETYSFFGRLENLPIPEPESGDTEVLSGFMLLGLWNDNMVKRRDQTGPPLLVEAIEFEAPYWPQWPPESHTRIFFDSPDRGDPETWTRQIVARFAERAFRRPVRDDEVERYVQFWRDLRADYPRYEDGVREVLVAVLCSPAFLYLAGADAAGPGSGAPDAGASDAGASDAGAADAGGPGAREVLSDHALASRLAYFLWNSPPDDELLALARAGSLRAALLDQVDRLVDDARSDRFVRAFTHEWLRLDRLEGITIDVDAFPDFTRFVRRDMAEETHRFVAHVLREDLDVLTLIDSDFAMLNQNLAEFYGIEGVRGPRFRPVPLPPDSHRGGLLSQGAFLTGHSDGRQPHPIKRAVWLKEKILGDAPKPPPPNVPDLDPDTPGFAEMTLKQQLEVHRDNPSCMECHAGLDPYGVVFERYSAIGRHETRRRGNAIDARTTLPDGTTLDGVGELKAWLRTSARDHFARALIEHLFAWALGRDLGFADRAEVDRILEQVRVAGYRMRAVVRAIASSPAFSRH